MTDKGDDNVRLGDIITLQRGYDLPFSRRRLGSVPIVSSSGITDFHDRSQAKAPGVITGRYGTIGNVFYIHDDYWPLNTTLFVTDFKGNIPRFIAYLLKRIDFHSYKGKSGVPGVNRNDLHEITVWCPTFLEQRAIADALSDADALIAALDALIAKKRDLKQAAMQQLLTGKTRLPGFSGAWKKQALFNLAENKKELFDDGDWIESEHIADNGIRLIQTGNIGIGNFIEKENKKYIFEKSFFELHCKEIYEGDLLICRLAEPAGRACILQEIGEEKMVTSVDVTIFRPPSHLADRKFLSYVFCTDLWFRTVSDRSGGTTHKRISRGALGKINVKLPEIDEQSAIAAILSDMDTELAGLESQRDKARAIKQGMMQELLTGRIRLI